jgi:hypothetical protein
MTGDQNLIEIAPDVQFPTGICGTNLFIRGERIDPSAGEHLEASYPS